MSSSPPSGSGTAARTRCTRRSLLVTVPSVSHHPADPGRITSAISAVRFAKHGINGGFFFEGWFRVGEMQVHSVFQVFIDADRGGLEFRCSGLGVHGVNRPIIPRYLVVKMDGEKRQSRPQSRIEPHWRNHGSAPRTHAYFFALTDLVALAILWRKINRRPPTERRRKSLALRPRVIGIQMAAGRKPKRILLV